MLVRQLARSARRARRLRRRRVLGRRRVVRERGERFLPGRQARAAEVLAERRQVDAASHDLRVRDRVDRLEHVRLGLEHLVAHRVVERLAAEPDETEPEQVVEVCRHAFDVAAAGKRADHRQPGRDQLRADHPERATGAHVDRRLRALDEHQLEDPRLVGRQLGQDALVRGMRLELVVDVPRGAAEARPAPAASAAGRCHSRSRSRAPRRGRTRPGARSSGLRRPPRLTTSAAAPAASAAPAAAPVGPPMSQKPRFDLL